MIQALFHSRIRVSLLMLILLSGFGIIMACGVGNDTYSPAGVGSADDNFNAELTEREFIAKEVPGEIIPPDDPVDPLPPPRPEVFAAGSRYLAISLFQIIICDAETTGREQIVAIPVVFKCTWLSDEAIDNMSIINRMLALTAQSRQRIDSLLCVPYLQTIYKKTHLNAFADQSTVHRIEVVIDPDGAAGSDCH